MRLNLVDTAIVYNLIEIEFKKSFCRLLICLNLGAKLVI